MDGYITIRRYESKDWEDVCDIFIKANLAAVSLYNRFGFDIVEELNLTVNIMTLK